MRAYPQPRHDASDDRTRSRRHKRHRGFLQLQLLRHTHGALTRLLQRQIRTLHAPPYELLDLDNRTDYILLPKFIQRQLQSLADAEKSYEQLQPIVEPFASRLVNLIEGSQKVAPATGKYAANVLAAACKDLRSKLSAVDGARLELNGTGGRFAAYRATKVLAETGSIV